MAITEEKPESTLREDVVNASLEKVLARHGRVDLAPLPSDLPEDPLNWSSFRKNMLLALVAFHACLGPFSAACVSMCFDNHHRLPLLISIFSSTLVRGLSR